MCSTAASFRGDSCPSARIFHWLLRSHALLRNPAKLPWPGNEREQPFPGNPCHYDQDEHIEDIDHEPSRPGPQRPASTEADRASHPDHAQRCRPARIRASSGHCRAHGREGGTRSREPLPTHPEPRERIVGVGCRFEERSAQ